MAHAQNRKCKLKKTSVLVVVLIGVVLNVVYCIFSLSKRNEDTLTTERAVFDQVVFKQQNVIEINRNVTGCVYSQCVDPQRDSYVVIDNLNQQLSIEIFEQLSATKLSGLFKRFTPESDVRRFMLNVTLSDKLPLYRPFNYPFAKECSRIKLTSTPQVSVVIPFHNEAWSMLLRTINSIINTSPLHLIKEIILVDDQSTLQNLQEPLTDYLQQVPNVLMVRTHKREGLIRARMVGAKRASGDVIIFLDAHIELGANWLEPLLVQVVQDPKSVAIPTVNFMDPFTLDIFPPNNYFTAGIFTWELDYVWKNIKLDGDPAKSYPSMSTIGCATAVDRQNFLNSGGYDEGLVIWGGENLEMSFKAWMCGGSVQIVPCSNVAHVFRSHLPYSFPSNDVIYRNLQRVALVWMDTYASEYFLTTGKIIHMTPEEIQGIKDLRQKRLDNQCTSFERYLSAMPNDLQVSDQNDVVFGQLKSTGLANLCITIPDPEQTALALDSCFLRNNQQVFHFNGKQIRELSSNRCISLGVDSYNIKSALLEDCNMVDPLQSWSFDPIVPVEFEQQLVGVDTRKPVGRFRLTRNSLKDCLTVASYKNQHRLTVMPCGDHDVLQFWVVTHKVYNHLREKIQRFLKQFD